MATHVNIREARSRLSQLIKQAEAGHRIVVARRGIDVAELGPVRKTARKLPDMSLFRASIRIKGEPMSRTVSRMRDEERY